MNARKALKTHWIPNLWNGWMNGKMFFFKKKTKWGRISLSFSKIEVAKSNWTNQATNMCPFDCLYKQVYINAKSIYGLCRQNVTLHQIIQSILKTIQTMLFPPTSFLFFWLRQALIVLYVDKDKYSRDFSGKDIYEVMC